MGEYKVCSYCHLIQPVQAINTFIETVSDPDDPQGSYLLHCWGRMCRVMGDGFLPYLNGVMPPLIQLASAKADVQLLDGMRSLIFWEVYREYLHFLFQMTTKLPNLDRKKAGN